MQQDNWRTRRWHVIRTAAGFPRLRSHDLRHTRASQLLDAGVQAAVVAEILGHASTRMISERDGHALSGRHDEALLLLAQRSAAIRSRKPAVTRLPIAAGGTS